MPNDINETNTQKAIVFPDQVKINLVVSRDSLENDTVEMLREAGNHSEEQLNVIGLVEYLVEHHGHHYGPFLIQAIHIAMSFDGHENPLQAIEEQAQELIDLYSQPYVPEDEEMTLH